MWLSGCMSFLGFWMLKESKIICSVSLFTRWPTWYQPNPAAPAFWFPSRLKDRIRPVLVRQLLNLFKLTFFWVTAWERVQGPSKLTSCPLNRSSIAFAPNLECPQFSIIQELVFWTCFNVILCFCQGFCFIHLLHHTCYVLFLQIYLVHDLLRSNSFLNLYAKFVWSTYFHLFYLDEAISIK